MMIYCSVVYLFLWPLYIDVDTRRLRRWKESDMLLAIEAVKSGSGIKTASQRFSIPAMTLWRWTQKCGVMSVYSHFNARRSNYPEQSSANAQPARRTVHHRRRRSPRTSSVPIQESYLASMVSEPPNMNVNLNEGFSNEGHEHALQRTREVHANAQSALESASLPWSDDQSRILMELSHPPEGPSGLGYRISMGSLPTAPHR